MVHPMTRPAPVHHDGHHPLQGDAGQSLVVLHRVPLGFERHRLQYQLQTIGVVDSDSSLHRGGFVLDDAKTPRRESLDPVDSPVEAERRVAHVDAAHRLSLTCGGHVHPRMVRHSLLDLRHLRRFLVHGLEPCPTRAETPVRDQTEWQRVSIRLPVSCSVISAPSPRECAAPGLTHCR